MINQHFKDKRLVGTLFLNKVGDYFENLVLYILLNIPNIISPLNSKIGSNHIIHTPFTLLSIILDSMVQACSILHIYNF